MRLHRLEGGAGERVALLLHGFNCDAHDWSQVAPILVDKGYRVVALDLRGHGESDRAREYRLADFAADVVESMAGESVDLVIGHSLGAAAGAIAVERIRPKRAIYLDPPWSSLADETRAELFPDLERVRTMSDPELAAVLHAQFPRWSDEAVRTDVASWRRWDPASVEVLSELFVDSVPDRAVVPSLVVAADPSIVFAAREQATAEARGFEVRVASGLSHSMFRDDLDAFFAALDGWV